MKKLFAILFFSYINSLFALSVTDTLKQKNSFNELTIRHIYGDEYHNVEEMKFVKVGDEIIASISIPDNNLLENSKTKLTKENTLSIKKFITKAYDFEENCLGGMSSSSVRYYYVNIDGKEIVIRRLCNWGDSNYIKLKNQIFGTYLKKLEEKREQLNYTNNELILGLWKFDFSIHKIIKDKIYTLNRIKNRSNSKCYIGFKKERKLVDYYCLKNSRTRYNFRFDIVNEDLLLYIDGDNKNDRKDFIYGYVFKVVQLGKNEIKLTTTD